MNGNFMIFLFYWHWAVNITDKGCFLSEGKTAELLRMFTLK